MTENKNTDELMQVGRTAGAYGVRGWVRVVPMGRQGDLLFESDRWWFLPYPRKPGVSPKLLTVSELKAHGKDFIAKIEEIHTREEAMALKGSLLVDRNDLPQLQEGDYYDEDLAGLTVRNLQDEVLGEVVGVTDNGAQDLLAVRATEGDVFYIPMVEAYIEAIDFDQSSVIVDWSLDWN